MLGSVANTPPERIAVVFRDDSPEDNHPLAFGNLPEENIQGGVGAAVKLITVTIVTQGLEELTRDEREAGEVARQLPEEQRKIHRIYR